MSKVIICVTVMICFSPLSISTCPLPRSFPHAPFRYLSWSSEFFVQYLRSWKSYQEREIEAIHSPFIQVQAIYTLSKIEGVQVTFDIILNSPCLQNEVKSDLQGELCSLSDVTQGLFPCTPSIILAHTEKQSFRVVYFLFQYTQSMSISPRLQGSHRDLVNISPSVKSQARSLPRSRRDLSHDLRLGKISPRSRPRFSTWQDLAEILSSGKSQARSRPRFWTWPRSHQA